MLRTNLTIEEVKEEIKIAMDQQLQLDNELDRLLLRRQYIKQKIQDTAIEPIPELNTIEDETKAMEAKVVQSSMAAQDLSRQVRELDTAQFRLKKIVKRVEGVLNLTNTIESVERAIEQNDLETAAKETYHVLYLQKPIQNDVSYDVLIGLESKVRSLIIMEVEQAQTNENLANVLRFCKLFPLIQISFRGLQIYCQVVRQTLSQQLVNNGLTLKSQPSNAVIPFATLLSKIFDRIALAVQEHVKPLNNHFCEGGHLRLLQELQAECDLQVTQLLRRFIEDKHLVAYVAKIKKITLRRKGSNDGKDDDDLDPRLLDPLLEDIAYISRESEYFDINLRKFGKRAEESLEKQAQRYTDLKDNTDPPQSQENMTHDQQQQQQQQQQQPQQQQQQQQTKSDCNNDNTPLKEHATLKRVYLIVHSMKNDGSFGFGLARCSQVNEVVQEIIGHYISLEEYFMFHNIQKAIRIDEHLGGSAVIDGSVDGSSSSTPELSTEEVSSPSSSNTVSTSWFSPKLHIRFKKSLTSTMVDDTFYILKKCTERAFSTSSVSSACAIINHVNAILSREYQDVLSSIYQSYVRIWQPTAAVPIQAADFGQTLAMFSSLDERRTLESEKKIER